MRTIFPFLERHSKGLAAIGLTIFVLFVFTQRWFELYLQVRAYQLFTVGAALGFIIIGCIDRENFKNRLTIIDLLWFIAISVIIINIFLVGYSDNLSPLFFYVSGFLFLLITKVDINVYKSALILVKYGGLVYAIGSIAQYLFTDSFNNLIFNFTTETSQDSITRLTRGNYYPGFGFGQTSVATGYTGMALGYIWTFWDRSKAMVFKYLDFGLFGLILFGLMVIGRRIPFIFAIFAIMITYWLLSQGKEKWKRFIIISFASIGLLLGFVILFQIADTPQFLIRFERMISDLMAGNIPRTLQIRFILYEQAWVLFTENKLTGIGWFEFQYLNPGEHHVHNAPLQLLAEIGLIGFVAMLIPIIYVYNVTLKAYNRAFIFGEKIDTMWRKGLAFSLFYQTFFLLNSLMDTVFFHIVFVLMYFFSISIVNSYLVIVKDKSDEDKTGS